MKASHAVAVFAVLAAAAIGGMVVVELDARDARTAKTAAAASGSELPSIFGKAEQKRGLMSPAPNAPTRIVPVLDQDVKATTPLLAGRDCLASPARCHNGLGGIDLVYAAAADIPAQPMRATVLSDSGCEPDQHGASHCLNTMRLETGKVIYVRNDHRLANEPCLAAGEHIIVAPGAAAAAQLAGLRKLAADKGGAWPSNKGMIAQGCIISDAGLKRAGITRADLACSKTPAT